MTTYALLVGINAYEPPVRALRGCVDDVEAFATLLRARVTDDLQLRQLIDAEATRAAFLAACSAHLGRSTRQDVALLYYAGHGSEEPAPPELAALEPSGRLQTLVLHDCGRRVDGRVVRPVADKELAAVLAELSSRAGHVAVVLDCCHSGDADRDVATTVRAWSPDPTLAEPAWRDVVAELARPRPVAELSTALAPAARASRHVTLSACRAEEKAREVGATGGPARGVFSVALVDALAVLGARPTYRALLGAVRSRVERVAANQHPVLAPLDAGGPADALFLDGTVTSAPPAFTMTASPEGWEIDGGLVHGLRDPIGDESFVLACRAPDGTPAGCVRVVAVGVGRATVEPLGWEPVDSAYAATVVDVPLPAAEVQLDPPQRGLEAVTERIHAALRTAVATAGADGGPSPDVCIVASEATTSVALRLRVAVPAAGVLRLTRADGSALTADTAIDAGNEPSAARLAVAQLAHVAAWERIRGLAALPSSLRDAPVHLELFASAVDEATMPAGRPPLDPTDGYRLVYQPATDGTWSPPYVFARVVNSSDAALYVAVLDMTDRYACTPILQTIRLAGRGVYALFDGRNLSVTLPPGRRAQPGASGHDWLLLITSEVDFDASAFELSALDEPSRRHRGGAAGTSLERLARRAVWRGASAPVDRPDTAGWSVTTVPLDVTVPA